ncbi:hypothetical protein MPSEU_000053100 [Mayamaea pseudoterrestris]|nr:hypothetical protein MPSEU_000053100 [Mayamaea pseudoterrestris]
MIDSSILNDSSSRPLLKAVAATSGSDFESCTGSSSEDEGIDETISFLHAKQSLLQRAFQILREEEAFNAANAIKEQITIGVSKKKQNRNATATATIDHRSSSPQSPSDLSFSSDPDEKDIWTEAREFLISILSPEDTPSSLLLLTTPQQRAAATKRKRCLPNPSHPLIDTSNVQKVNAASFVEETPCQDTQFVTTLPSTVFGKGQWMARALLWGEPCQRFGIDCSWLKFYDPYTCSAGLIAPKQMSMRHAIDLHDAMVVTNEPRLLTQATPPFCVVHVNRAFLKLAGVGDCVPTPDTMVGRPVESFFQVTQVVGPPEDKQQNYLESILAFENDTRLTCRIKVVPVMDRLKRRKLSQHNIYSCMSHVLIKVQHVSEHVNEVVAPLMRKTSSASFGSAESSSSGSDGSSDESSDGPNHIVSAVG